MSGEKTEEPTRKKLKKAREDGEVAKSTDLVEVACLAGILALLVGTERFLSDSLHAVIHGALDFMNGPRTLQDVRNALTVMAGHAAGLMIGALAVSLVAAVVALVPQTGLVFSMKAVIPKFNAVNPSSGLQKIFSVNAVVDLAKMTVKAAAIVAVMWQAIESSLPVVASSLNQSLPQLIVTLWSVVLHVLGVALLAFIVIAAVDYKLQMWLFTRKQRMSKDDVKREFKDSDGNPELKGERKRLAHQLSNETPKRHISRANVVVVNPVHYAVALRYDPTEYPLPVVIAKGTDEQALALRREAAAIGIPIVANPPVARMLHKVPESQPIPEELFEVVAAILRWINGLAIQTVTTEQAPR